MVKIIFCLRRRTDLSREEFGRYWREEHAPLVRERARLLGIRRYVQSHTLSGSGLDWLANERGFAGEPFDGVAELWFDSITGLTSSAVPQPASADAARKLLEDEARFIDLANSPIFVVEENEVLSSADGGERHRLQG